MELKKILTGVLAAGLCAANLASIPANAYGRTAANVYAARWAYSYNPAYLQIDSGNGSGDCTNFVSQCVKAGGIAQTRAYTYDVPPVYRNWSMKSTVTQWYMSEKKTRTVGLAYWAYSSSWSQVSHFRTYMKNSGKASVVGYPVNGSTAWFSTVQIGDVVQNGITGAGHSVLIVMPKSGNNNPTYAGHSDSSYGKDLSNMITDARRRGADYLYAVRFY